MEYFAIFANKRNKLRRGTSFFSRFSFLTLQNNLFWKEIQEITNSINESIKAEGFHHFFRRDGFCVRSEFVNGNLSACDKIMGDNGFAVINLFSKHLREENPHKCLKRVENTTNKKNPYTNE